MIYSDIYTFPLRLQEDNHWVRDANSIFVFQFEITDKVNMKNILSIINGNIKPKIKYNFIHKDGMISLDGTDYILIRGWGYLTGTGGGLGLSPEEAANIQDTFAEYICNRLNNKI